MSWFPETGRERECDGAGNPGNPIAADPATVEWQASVPGDRGATGDIREGRVPTNAMSQETCRDAEPKGRGAPERTRSQAGCGVTGGDLQSGRGNRQEMTGAVRFETKPILPPLLA